MKRNIVLVLVVAALAAVVVGNRGQAQAPSAQTKVATINVGEVFTKYEKAKFFKAEMEAMLKPLKTEAERLKAEMISWDKQMGQPGVDAKLKERFEQGIRDNKRKIEDLDATARKQVGQKQEEQLIGLYRDMQDAVKGYAASNGIHIVMAYGDPTDANELMTFANISRKMQAMDVGGSTPFYTSPGVDISVAIVNTLNSRYRSSGAPMAPTTNVTPAGFTAPPTK